MSRAQIGRLEAELGELIERHERARDLGEFKAYASDPVGFIREVLRGEPYPAQIEVAESFRDYPLVAVRSGNGLGKDWLASRLLLWTAYARGSLCLILGPTQRQVREIVFAEIRRAWSAAGDLPGELYTTALRLGDDETAGIIGFVSNETSRMTGFHAPRVSVVLTEAQGCDAAAWEASLACAVGSEDRVLAVGNPLHASGRFFEVNRSPDWRVHSISAYDSPNVVEGVEKIPGMVTRAGIERIEREYGKGSGIARARVLGEFPESGENSLIPRSWLDAAVEKWKSGTFSAEAAIAKPVLGVDPARYGTDSTVCALRRGPLLERLTSWNGLSTMETADRVAELATSCGIWPSAWRGGPRGSVWCDEVGVGGGVLDRLQELGYRAFAYNASRGATDPRKYANVRAESYWQIRKQLEEGAISLPDSAKLLDELGETWWAPDNAGRIAIEPKDALKSRLGRSPDFADAAVIAMYAGSQPVWKMVRRREAFAGIRSM